MTRGKAGVGSGVRGDWDAWVAAGAYSALRFSLVGFPSSLIFTLLSRASLTSAPFSSSCLEFPTALVSVCYQIPLISP